MKASAELKGVGAGGSRRVLSMKGNWSVGVSGWAGGWSCVEPVDGMGDGALGRVVGRAEGRCEIEMLKADWMRGGGTGIEW